LRAPVETIRRSFGKSVDEGFGKAVRSRVSTIISKSASVLGDLLDLAQRPVEYGELDIGGSPEVSHLEGDSLVVVRIAQRWRVLGVGTGWVR
jgi:hypothetical protein